MSGKNSDERKNVRSQLGIFDCTSSASAKATASCTITAVMTNPMVFRNDTRIVGFATDLDEVVDTDELRSRDDVPAEERQHDRGDDRE